MSITGSETCFSHSRHQLQTEMQVLWKFIIRRPPLQPRDPDANEAQIQRKSRNQALGLKPFSNFLSTSSSIGPLGLDVRCCLLLAVCSKPRRGIRQGPTSRAFLLMSSLCDALSVPLPDAGTSCICLPVDRSGGGDWPRSTGSGMMLEMMEARVGGVSGLAHCQTLPAKGDGGIRLHFWMFVSQLPVFVVNSHKLLLSIKLDSRAAVRSTYIPFELSVDIRAPLHPVIRDHYIMARQTLGPLALLGCCSPEWARLSRQACHPW